MPSKKHRANGKQKYSLVVGPSRETTEGKSLKLFDHEQIPSDLDCDSVEDKSLVCHLCNLDFDQDETEGTETVVIVISSKDNLNNS